MFGCGTLTMLMGHAWVVELRDVDRSWVMELMFGCGMLNLL